MIIEVIIVDIFKYVISSIKWVTIDKSIYSMSISKREKMIKLYYYLFIFKDSTFLTNFLIT
jgi:hypothetical protein